MTTPNEALLQALDALKGADQIDVDMQDAIVAIEAAIALPVQPALRPLTDEQRLKALKSVDGSTQRLPTGFKNFARAIEAAMIAAHNIKATP